MSESENVEVTAVVSEPALKSKTYRVFKLDAVNGIGDKWIDLGQHTGEGVYGYYLTAEILGGLWGAGDYMYFENSPYSHVEFMGVVAGTVYRQREDQGPGL